MSEQHQEALAHLLYGITIDGGFVLLTGEVGTGKTTVARQLLEQLPQGTDVAVILNPRQSVVELLQSICDELHLPPTESGSVKTLVDRIQSELLRRYAEGRNTVLLIDEAQQLSVDLLEQVRLLTNLETSEHKLLNIILLGQPELLELLAREELRQLSQRITARYHLGPLSLRELPLYIRHRLSVAGLNRPVFPDPVIKQLYKLSGGLPRLINLIGDRALLGAYVQKQNEVTTDTLRQAAREVLGEDIPRQVPARLSKRMILAAAVVVGLLAWGTGLSLSILYQGELGGRWLPQVVDWFDPAVQAGQVQQATVVTGVPHAEPSTQHNPQKKADANPVPVKPYPGYLAEASYHSGNRPIVQERATGVTEQAAAVVSDNASQAESEVVQAVVVEPAADLAAEPSADKPMEWPRMEDRDLAQVLAYRRLFKAWQIDYDPRQQPVVCDFAESQGLACLSLAGSTELLQQLDRPAVVEFQHLGVDYQMLVLSLDERQAQVYTDGEAFAISRHELDEGWQGQFTLLWRPPPDYSAPI